MSRKYFVLVPILAIAAGVVVRNLITRPAEPEYCAAPPSNMIRENYLLGEGTKWQTEYERMADQWLQCTRDLARVSEECNHEIICSEGTCEDR